MISTDRTRLFGTPIMGALLILAGTQPAAGQRREIIGTWRGTATCANRAKYIDCRDQAVIYQIDTIGATRGNVMLRAHEVVNHDQRFIYAMQFARLPGSRTWQADFTSSTFHGRWEYTISGGVMTGRLIELPNKRLVRRVSVRLSAPIKRGI